MAAEQFSTVLTEQLLQARARIAELESIIAQLQKESVGATPVSLDPPSFILESITDAFVAVDRDFRYIWVNREAERFTGMSRDQLLGRSIWELFPEVVGSTFEEKCRYALAEHVQVKFENFHAGWNRWFYNRAFPTREGGLAIYWREITEQKRAEANLRRQTLVLDQVHDSIISTDLQGNITRWNRGAEKMFGYKAEEVLGRSVRLLYFEEDRAQVGARVLEPLFKDGQSEVELRNQRISGEECYIRLSLSLLQDEAGQPYGMLGVATDITAQRQAELALRESEDRYRCLANAMPQVAYITGPDGKTQMVNRHWEEYSGIASEQCLEFDWQAWVHPDDVAPILPQWMECVRTGQLFEMEYRLRDRNGRYRWHLSRAVPVLGPDRGIRQWVGTVTDIHDHKIAEEALQRSEERLRLAFRAVEGMVYDWDPRTGAVHRSENLIEILGVRVDQAAPTEQWWQERVHPEDRARTSFSVLQHLGSDQSTFETEYRIRHTGGHWVHACDRGYVVRDERGAAIRVVGSTHDVTERKRLQSELEENNRQLRFQANILATTDDAVIALDADNRIKYVNAGAERLYGIRGSDVIGKPLTSAYESSFANPEEEQRARRDVATNGTWKGENIHLRQDGTKITVLSTVNLLPAELGGGMVVVIRDNSARKRAELEIQRHAAQLARANEDLLHFAYAVSHDLQTPVRTIGSFSKLLALKYKAAFDAEGAQFLTWVVDASARMSTMIRDLLQFAKVAGEEVPFRKTVGLEEVLTAAVTNLRVRIEEAGAALTHDPLPSVAGDGGQLEQLFQNLIENSLKYRKPDTLPAIHISAEQREGEWVISVRDNGIGFDPQYAERIFGVFQRLQEGDVAGTGIGLTICKRIVERHQGRIWAAAEPGQGATFSFSIPDRAGEAHTKWESPPTRQAEPILRPPEAGPAFDELFHALDLAQASVRKLDGTILIWTQGAERMFGWSKLEAVGRRVHDLLRTGFPKALEQIEADLLRNGEWTGELRKVKRDGSTVWLASHWALYRDGSGRPQSVIEVDNDITAFKEAEEALRRSTEQRDLALRAGQMGVWQWDSRSGVVEWDETIEGFLGMPAGSFERTHEAFLQRVHPEDRGRVQQRIAAAMEKGAEYNVEFRMGRADGSYLWFRGQGQVILEGGKAAGMIGVVWDVTPRKQAELDQHSCSISARS